MGKRIAALACLCSAAIFFRASGQTASVPSGSTKTAEQAYKNIQVLKTIPADQLIPAMQFIAASLGVECGFCHVENHFDQDDKKPKQTARKMMQMMMAINQNNFDGHRAVTCNSCHRGSRNPVQIPLISEASTPAQPASSEEQLPLNLPTADELIAKFVQAAGGDAALRKISSRYEKGTMSFFGREVAIEIFDKAPGKRFSVTHLPDGDSITDFDGETGWLAAPHRPTREMPGVDLAGARMDADLQLPLHLKELFGDLLPARPEKVGDRDTYQLVAENAGQPRGRLYFDQQSGLLVRLIRYSDSPLGLNPLRIDYADYRAVDGVQIPFRWTMARPAGRFTIQLTSVEQNIAIDDGKFAKPAGSNDPADLKK